MEYSIKSISNSKLQKIILIGASTGGPGLIEQIVTSLSNSFQSTIIIAQHMNKLHLESFAKRLDMISTINVKFISETTPLKQNTIYLLADTAIIISQNNTYSIEKKESDNSYYHPTIDELFFSASTLNNINITAYLLSGIGSDGAKGMLSLKKSGFKTVAQDEKTSIVYGMPKSAYELHAVQYVMSINDIVKDIQKEL